MDVTRSRERPSELLIYLVNHREPFEGKEDAREVGADSVIEIFETTPGGGTMRYVATFKDPVIATPNDIAATGDEMDFYFTNDHGFTKTGFVRFLSITCELETDPGSYRLGDTILMLSLIFPGLMSVTAMPTKDAKSRQTTLSEPTASYAAVTENTMSGALHREDSTCSNDRRMTLLC